MKKRFGEKVRALREAKGLTLRDMVAGLEELGVKLTHSTISRWELDETQIIPRRKTLAAVAKYFDVTPAFLLSELMEEQKARSPGQRELEGLELLDDDEFAVLESMLNIMLANKGGRNSVSSVS